MSTPKIIIFCLFLCLGLNSLRADLGDSIDESSKKYGVPIPSSMHRPVTGYDEMIFVKDGIWLEARFFDGKCCRLTYQKKTTEDGPNPQDREWGADNGPFTSQEVTLLLKKNSQNHTWASGEIISDNGLSAIKWKRDDGALALEKGHILEFYNSDNESYEAALSKEKAH